MNRLIILVLFVLALFALPSSVAAQWRAVDPGEARDVARSELTVRPSEAWNRSTRRPARWIEVWTQDGPALNEIDFFAGIKSGKPLFKEQDRKKAPLPKFDPNMLPTDLVELWANTAQIVLGASLFEVENVEPATLAGRPGVHFRYRYTGADNLDRRGEVRAAVIGNELYMINFDAPQIHYFDDGIEEARAIMDSARLEN